MANDMDAANWGHAGHQGITHSLDTVKNNDQAGAA